VDQFYTPSDWIGIGLLRKIDCKINQTSNNFTVKLSKLWSYHFA
jgi:hypothetical protein